MRYIETILKLLFVIFAGISWYMKIIPSLWFWIFLGISLLLGIVLIFNRDSSYHYPQTKNDFIIRRIEGIVLIVFSITVAVLLN